MADQPPASPTPPDIFGGNIDPAKLAAAASSLHTLGVVFLVLGFMGVLLPELASLVIALMAGYLLIFFGFIGIAGVFVGHGKHHPHRVMVAIISVVSIVCGVILLDDPAHTINTLTLLLAVVLLIQGVVEFSWAMRPELAGRRGWLVLTAICSFLLSGIIFAHWPHDIDWILGLLVSIRLVFLGATFMSLPTNPPPPPAVAA
jgi:uncharacterized membrane protein HdeD (DUF308 family)